ncbi:hypothetical protein P5F43_15220 [Clostridium perfringens]|uniref:hypothetical protein n=1 Tax=Clostridium TaxID=1485 RepID=UPI000D859405|nr:MULTISPECIES: hypothetical protein [Clostridium]ELC8368280.1 hypothetical protein [Clostridium perfringens]MBI6111833.1 hypothetical protein [Clostridium perfringens]MBI6114888.1 hypothetical protein [Clostridium perfringens]MDK0888332.1 hypothetical protein [Clostridium perfringens]PWX25744.1 hypothetical protein CYK95_12720 [Clostridium perfringens]
MGGYAITSIIFIILFWCFVNSNSCLGTIIRWAIIISYSGMLIQFLREGHIKSALLLGVTLLICFAPLIYKKIVQFKN